MNKDEQKLTNKFLLDIVQSDKRFLVDENFVIKISDILDYWREYREKIESLEEKKDA